MEDGWELIDCELEGVESKSEQSNASNRFKTVFEIPKEEIEYITVAISINNANVCIKKRSTTIPPAQSDFIRFRFYNEIHNNWVKSLSDWSKAMHKNTLENSQSELVEDPHNECLLLIHKLHSVYNTALFDYHFLITDCEGDALKRLISKCLPENYKNVRIFENTGESKESLSSDETDYIMNNVKTSAYLDINCKLPEGYQHEKAFKFSSVDYQYASWVTLDNLKSIRNLERVHLCGTNFSCEELSQFLQYWTNCEEDMMIKLNVYFNKTEIDENTVLNGLLYTAYPWPLYNEEPTRYIKCRFNGKRQLLVAELRIHKTGVSLTARKPDGFYQIVLRTLLEAEEATELSNERIINVEESDGYKLLLEDYEEGSDEEVCIRQEIERLEERRKFIDIYLKQFSLKTRRSGFKFTGNPILNGI